MSRLKLKHRSAIIRLATPTVITMLSHTLMWTVDTAFLGRVSSLALAAGGLGGVIIWTLYALFNNLSRINSTFVAQANGKGDNKLVGEYTWQACYVAVLGGLLLTAMGHLSYLALPLTKNGPDIESATYTYMAIRSLSAVPTQLTFALGGFFQGRQDVRTPMWAGVAANGVNVVLDYLLIFGWPALGIPPMGIAGAAWATSIGVAVNALILVLAALVPASHRRLYRLHLPRWPRPHQIWDILRIGMPASFYSFMDMSFFSGFTILIGRIGTAQLAASQITVQLLSFSFMPVFGLATAASVLVGNALGERDPDRAEEVAMESYFYTLLYTLALALLFVFFGRHLFALFSSDPKVLQLAFGLSLVAAVFQFFDGSQILGSNILSGAGDTRFPMVFTLLVLWLLAIPLIYIVIEVLGGDVIQGWASSALGYSVIAGGLFWRVRSGRWKKAEIFSGESR